MIRLSAVIISFNEEKDIGRCLKSLQGIADEILVLDSFSTDGTEAVCRSLGARFEQHAFDGYVSQKNRALGMAAFDYVLSLDADEALSEDAIRKIAGIRENWSHDGYSFRRRNSWCGHWMRFTTWYPDRKVRLFDRRKAKWVGLDPHDCIQMDQGGTVRHLDSEILHWAVHKVDEYRWKTDHFAKISAEHYFNKGIRPSVVSGVVHSSWRWIREYFVRLGILDGIAGWQVARFSALYVWKKYYYLRQLYGSQRQQVGIR